MMIGETHRLNPTVRVPPWPNLDDELTAEVYSPIKYNAADGHFNNNGKAFCLQEALAALQRYLPSKKPDFVDSDSDISGLENPDSLVEASSCDHFRMFEFKVRRCSRGRSHDWTECPYAHPGEKARRRDPRKYQYSGTACADFRKGNCRRGDACEFAHGVFECWLHPARYRTEPCKDGAGCKRRICFFAHSLDQLRVVNSGGSGSHSPISPRADSSPPVSPMAESLSRSLGSASVQEMIASLRNLQLGNVKFLSSSWNTQAGFCSSPSVSVFGSPREAVIRHGFCSLPSTPTRNLTRPGIRQLDFWEKGFDIEEEEEPAMERVESGRDLRAEVFEKLSRENSLLHRVDPGQGPGNPDVDWVSDLVK